ncbi:GNAT family N-acetyltransferase [Nocardioides sp. Y6]|uniref:GNAT family N-acetyltransferase n=1 Tax=Nocardioides malaquae TaxID=2773426 RepID=A0ABR9RVK4_9ACTN|nr:GNAT family N-acetyltransferase [Nocardioides malaquae]MBE7325603.1 GNAT family N-acetyltransferase [Nocardioides malaquae]
MDAVATTSGAIEVRIVAPGSAAAQAAQLGYLADVAARYYGRPATAEEMEAALRDHPIDELVAPDGLFLVATDSVGSVCGCVGLARMENRSGEVRRLHVHRQFRGRGLGRRLMTDLEHRARRMGIVDLRLDTRRDLVESQHLYEALGYHRSTPHSGGPYAEVFFTKSLG